MRRITRSISVVLAACAVVGTTALPAAAKTDKQIAKAASLKLADLSGDWTASKDADLPSGIAECEAIDDIGARSDKYEFNSPDFFATEAFLSNSVYVFPTVKQAKAYLAVFQDPAAGDCLQASLEDAFADSPGAVVDTGALDVSGGPADDGVGYQVDVALSNGDTFVLEAGAFRVGRGVTGITAQNPGGALPETADYVTLTIKRLRKGLK